MRHFIGVFICLFIVVSLPAQVGTGDDLTIKLALYGPGNEVYSWWGHNSLIIEDARTGQSISYNFGIFSFDENNFFRNFAFGRLLYSCGALPAENDINGYIWFNRDVILCTLDIPPEKREEVRDFVETSILPENRYYYYHLFNDSCSTRIRDIIDIATDGQFKEQFANEADRLTLRQHGRRYTWFSPLVEWSLCFLMGQDVDRPITVWDSMFLPSELANAIDGFVYVDKDGVSRELLSDVEVVYLAPNRFPVLDEPRKQWPPGLVVGIVAAVILVLLFFIQAKFPVCGQVALGITHSLLGLFFGVAGLLLFFMSFFTSHDYTYHNANLLFCNPLLLAAFPLGIKYAVSENYDKRLSAEFPLRIIWFLVVLGIITSMLIKLSPLFWQDNLPYQILMLPVALTLSLEPSGLKRLLQRIFWRWL